MGEGEIKEIQRILLDIFFSSKLRCHQKSKYFSQKLQIILAFLGHSKFSLLLISLLKFFSSVMIGKMKGEFLAINFQLS